MFVLDTNVLVNDPQSIFKFGEHEIIIPFVVLEELDGLKKRNDVQGRASRTVSRHLDSLREVGDLSNGVPLPGGGTLRVVRQDSAADTNDQRILALCQDLPEGARLITEDINLRIMADSLGIAAERYQNNMVETTSFYEAPREVEVSANQIDEIYATRLLSGHSIDAHANEYLTLQGDDSALARCRPDGQLELVGPRSAQGIKGRNREQKFAMDALLRPEIELVVLAGPAGTGKSLLAVAAGLEQTIDKQTSIYSKVTVARPIMPMGKDIGFLPGTMEEKLDPWMGPIYDAIDFLMPSHKPGYSNATYLKDKGHLNIEALTYIRGRSLPNQFIIIDEAQNLSQHEVKTIITRAGVGTKLVFTGDPYQIDSPYLDEYNNGISYIIDKFKGEETFAHVTLTKGERSDLAELAARIL